MKRIIKLTPDSLRRYDDGPACGNGSVARALHGYGQSRYLDGLSDAVNLIMAIGGDDAREVARQLDVIIAERRESLRRQEP